MQYDLEELFTLAIMLDKPIIIVEGHDDIKIYENMTVHIGKNCDVYAIENIEDYSEGCTQVIKAIENLQQKIEERNDNEKYVLGIIDRDSRHFKNSIPNLKCLFTLKYYSFESHFTSRYNLKTLIGEVTNNGNIAISKDILDYCEKDLEKEFRKLYYLSLEALKNALVQNYDSVIGYKHKAGALYNNQSFSDLIKIKRRNLNYFAKKLSLKYDIDTLKRITNGKWLLYFYAFSVLKRLKTLKESCELNEIKQCQYCKNGNHSKCLRKLNGNYSVDLIIQKLLNIYDKTELKYIYDRLSLLKNQN